MAEHGPTGLPLCAVCKTNEVPRAEWPTDPADPKICNTCLRANALTLTITPGGETRTAAVGEVTVTPQPETATTASSDFADSSDFG